MPKKRFLKLGTEGEVGRAVYHVVSRIVDRRFVLGEEEKQRFLGLMRGYERFSGCRVLGFCVMTNHFHLLLEVPPSLSGVSREEGEGFASWALSDDELLWRLGGIYRKAMVREIADELKRAREMAAEKDGEEKRRLGEAKVRAIHERYYYRMSSLSEFMKGLLQRFTRWFNRRHERQGVLWEERFRSVIVEGGVACRAVAAYIDLNPVRAGMVADPAHYRWSSYGEAVVGGKLAREGLSRALHGDERLRNGRGEEQRLPGWKRDQNREGVADEYRRILVAKVDDFGQESAGRRKTMSQSRDLKIARVVRTRIRHFTEGAVIGSRGFVEAFFQDQRDQFGPERKTGARQPRGRLRDLAGEIWSLRDLQTE